ncbi:ABC transporter permease subunit [Rossellomorea aquimaris]|uniref:ABC-type dipeptide/oligopeptide/nickel transport system permease component n=1 Tax=Rossellomorea aquimaris TaxID=189382 RepID=A0A366EKL9_9BACI|nr:ABC transporter permease subunit [Rossellomorea aquimaris]RBP02941.1 ABC-type dipeptide/oligopeptide/nickel transport system permease component [Rossellomorea aquimaris]
MKRVVDTSFHFLIVVAGLFLLSGVGSLLAYDTQLVVTVGYYFHELYDSIFELMDPSAITVYLGEQNRPYSLVKIALDTYGYSFTILISSFFLAICFSVLVSYFIMLSSRRGYRWSMKLLNVLDALPDVFIVVSFQIITIWLYKRTDILFFNIYAIHDERTYFLPIVCLSILPVVFLVKQFLFQLKEEESKPYVEFSLAKGFRKSYTVWFHLFRNVWIHFFLHLKPIFLLMLSNLLVIEILFNMNGFMMVLFRASTSSAAAFFVGMLLIFVPFFIVFQAGSYILKKWLNGGEYRV